MSKSRITNQVLWAVVFVLAALTLPSCSRIASDQETGLVGRWINMGTRMEIRNDGTLRGDIDGNRWTGTYLMVGDSKRKAYTRIPSESGRMFELQLLSSNTIHMVPIGDPPGASRRLPQRGRSPRKMVLSRSDPRP